MRKLSIVLSSLALAAMFMFIGASVSTVVYAATTACQVFNGCTGTTTQTTNGVTYYDGTQIRSGNGLTFTGTSAGIATTSPYAALSVVGSTGIVADKIAATSTSATSTFAGAITVGAGQGTSTFAGGISASRLNVTSGTSTLANGVNVTAGCFSRNGVCLGGGTGTVTSIATTYPLQGGPITTTGTLTLALSTTSSNTWGGTQTFNNATAANATTTGSQYITSLATPAGRILATDPTGKIVGTTTSSGGGGSSITVATGTSPMNVTVSSGQTIMVWAKGDLQDSFTTDTNIDLRRGGVTMDTVTVSHPGTSAAAEAFSLMFADTPGATTTQISVAAGGGTLENVLIMVQTITP